MLVGFNLVCASFKGLWWTCDSWDFRLRLIEIHWQRKRVHWWARKGGTHWICKPRKSKKKSKVPGFENPSLGGGINSNAWPSELHAFPSINLQNNQIITTLKLNKKRDKSYAVPLSLIGQPKSKGKRETLTGQWSLLDVPHRPLEGFKPTCMRPAPNSIFLIKIF